MHADPRVHLATLQRDGYACQHGAGGVRCFAPASAVVSMAGGWSAACKAHSAAHTPDPRDDLYATQRAVMTWVTRQ